MLMIKEEISVRLKIKVVLFNVKIKRRDITRGILLGIIILPKNIKTRNSVSNTKSLSYNNNQ